MDGIYGMSDRLIMTFLHYPLVFGQGAEWLYFSTRPCYIILFGICADTIFYRLNLEAFIFFMILLYWWVQIKNGIGIIDEHAVSPI